MRVVILERSPPTSPAVGVWIFGAAWPGRGIAENSPTTALGSSVDLSSSPSLITAAIRHSPSLGKLIWVE